MWTEICFWFCVVWGALMVAMILMDVKRADLVGFFVKGLELAFMILIALVLKGVLS